MVRDVTCTAKVRGAPDMELKVKLPAKWETKPLSAVMKLLEGHVMSRQRGAYLPEDELVLSVRNANGTLEELDAARCVSTLFTRDQVVLEARRPAGAAPPPAAAPPPPPPPTRVGFRAVPPEAGPCCHGRDDCKRFAIRRCAENGLRIAADGYRCDACGRHELVHAPAYAAGSVRRLRFVLLKPLQGLCNRLRALTAALFYVDDVERALGYAPGEIRIALDWVPDVACGCRFSDLFKPHPRIVELGSLDLSKATLDDVAAAVADVGVRATLARKVLEAEADRLKTRTASVTAERFAKACEAGRVCRDVDKLGKALKLTRRAAKGNVGVAGNVDVVALATDEFFYPPGAKDLGGDGGPCCGVDELLATRSPANNPKDDADTIEAFRSAYLRTLEPVDAVAARVPTLDDALAVHVRRTDNAASIIHSPPELFDDWVAARLARPAPPSKIYLATDDAAVEAAFLETWRGKIDVVTSAKRTAVDGYANRVGVDGCQDALVDLLALAACGEILGSFWSSYSRLAALWRNRKLNIVLRKTELADPASLEAAALGLGGLNTKMRPPDLAANRRLVHTIFPATKPPPDSDDE